MIAPTRFEEGVNNLRQEIDSEKIAVVVIGKTTEEADFAYAILDTIKDKLEVGYITEYIPPSGMGTRKYGRAEVLPKIQEPSLPHIIIDDFMEKGTTLEHAVRRLTELNIRLDKMWFIVNEVQDRGEIPIGGPYLDKVNVFLSIRDS